MAELWRGVPGVLFPCAPSPAPAAVQSKPLSTAAAQPPHVRPPPRLVAPAAKILDLEEDVDCVLIGTVYKEMRLKPSILDEYTKDMGAVQARARACSATQKRLRACTSLASSRLTSRPMLPPCRLPRRRAKRRRFPSRSS